MDDTKPILKDIRVYEPEWDYLIDEKRKQRKKRLADVVHEMRLKCEGDKS